MRHSKKLGFDVRRISIEGTNYSVQPSFVMPYMVGLTCELEKALYLRKYGVPYEGLAHVFGHDANYYERVEKSLGKNAVTATTVRVSSDLPEHLIADEKHTSPQGQKAYVASVCGADCVLNTALAAKSDEDNLTAAYGQFKQDAKRIDPNYQPSTVNIDGWKATKNAWQILFPNTHIVLCFLHAILGIFQVGRRMNSAHYHILKHKLWNCYQTTTKSTFSQRLRRLIEWAKTIDRIARTYPQQTRQNPTK